MGVMKNKERAILVSLELDSKEASCRDALAELKQLAYTAGAEVIDEVTQKREKPDVAYYIGRGKVEEVAQRVKELEADMVIINDDISTVQQRNLEGKIKVKVIDRTELILDIFAQRARTREGMLQVELAQLRYLLPRLTGRGVLMSRLGGGIGTRGPGETQLEYDRRRIRRRIGDLERKIREVQQHRALHRQARKQKGLPVVAITGYTNAGKSTLLNKLAGSAVYVDSKLFATLDPTTRKVELNGGLVVLVTDTVGFIRHLPHHLIAAFRATLEEVTEADFLIHVVDASHEQMEDQCRAVFSVLSELKAQDKPIITAFNKIDKLSNLNYLKNKVRGFPNAVLISALYGDGLPELRRKLSELVAKQLVKVKLVMPIERNDLIAKCYNQGRVLERRSQGDRTIISAEISQELANQLKDYILNSQNL